MKNKIYKTLHFFLLITIVSCSKAKETDKVNKPIKISEFDSQLKNFLEHGMVLEVNKVNLTPDSIPDFVCLEETLSFGNLEYKESFYDGKTKNSLESYDYLFPHSIEDYRFINVSKTEKCKAILFTVYSDKSYELRIAKYNIQTKKMEIIFEHSLLNLNEDTNKVEKVFYIDIFKSKKDFIDTISIYEGKSLDDNSSYYKLNIVPKDKKIIKKLIYNPSKQIFE